MFLSDEVHEARRLVRSNCVEQPTYVVPNDLIGLRLVDGTTRFMLASPPTERTVTTVYRLDGCTHEEACF
jgi:hypothetical protein